MNKLEKIINIVITALLIIIIALNISCIYQKFVLKQTPIIFGYSFAIVMSGSMEEEISVDDMIITQKQDNYNIGDIITFKVNNPKYNNNTVTHRIIEKTKDNNKVGFITKGDANNIEDEDIVYNENIVGKVIKIVPNVGITLDYVKTPEGMISILMVILIIYELIVIIQKIIEDGKRKI